MAEFERLPPDLVAARAYYSDLVAAIDQAGRAAPAAFIGSPEKKAWITHLRALQKLQREHLARTLVPPVIWHGAGTLPDVS
jgi:hypothetical protein